MEMRSSKRLLSLAVMAVLLSGGSTVWANPVPPDADETITSSNILVPLLIGIAAL